jgi:hypothetical protein
VAIYHLTTRAFSRARGPSARRKFDYLTREGLYAKDAAEVFFKASGNLPEWAVNGRAYWEGVDLYERKNARLGREVEVALPRELSTGEQIKLAKAFTDDLVESRHPYTLALHHGRGNNPHAHLIFSERALDGLKRSETQFFMRANALHPEQGGAAKSRLFRDRAWLEATRARWAFRVNQVLERNGLNIRVDHRTLEAQGVISRLPSRHVGPKVLGMEERGVATDKGLDLARAQEEIIRFAAKAAALRGLECELKLETRGYERTLGRSHGEEQSL